MVTNKKGNLTEDVDQAKELSSPLPTPTIKVLVGKRKIEYDIQRALLAKSSHFFKACLTHGMKENEGNVIELPEDSCAGFELLVDWIKQKKIRAVVGERGVVLAMEAYVLADKYGMVDLQNGLIDKIQRHWCRDRMPASHFTWILEHDVTERCPLYELGLDHLLWGLMLSPRRHREKERDFEIAESAKVNSLEQADHSRPRPWEIEVDELFSIPGVHAKVSKAMRDASIEDLNPLQQPMCAYHIHRVGGNESQDENDEDLDGRFEKGALCASMAEWGVY